MSFMHSAIMTVWKHVNNGSLKIPIFMARRAIPMIAFHGV